MVRNSSAKIFFVFLVSGLFTVLTTLPALSHSGHKHESALQVSLPKVVAKVNKTDILKETIEKELKRAIENYKNRGMPLTVDQEKSAAKKLIQDEIGRVLLVQKAMEIGADVSNSIVEDRLNKVKSSFKSDAVFEHKLADEGLTLKQYRDELKIDLSMDAVIKKEIEPNINIEPSEAQAYFEKNIDQFKTEDKVRASVILIKINPEKGSLGEKESKEKINSIFEQIKIGADFKGIAQRHSQDSLAAKGGDLGFFTRKQMFPAFSSRAFKMKVGEVSEVFKTGHGFHILKVTDKKSGEAGSFEKQKGKIENILRSRKLQQATLDYIETLKKKANIKNYF